MSVSGESPTNSALFGGHRSFRSASSKMPAAGFATPASAGDSSLLGSLLQPTEMRTERAAPETTRELVAAPAGYAAGTILVDTPNRALYLIGDKGEAIRYRIGVARAGFEWGGRMTIGRKAEWPSWTPPAEMLKRRPDLPRYMPGGPENPLGARAMYLGSSLYRIHGSNEPETIGQAVSSGCIRMLNDDVVDLYSRATVGAQVIVQR
jgi:lipoprotein-anchoring transpeptidase ErfK/SrfK